MTLQNPINAWSNPYEIQVAATGAVIARVDDLSLEAIAEIVRREVHVALYDSPEHEDDVPAQDDEERVEASIVTVKGESEDDKLLVLDEDTRNRYTIRYDMGFDNRTTVEIEEEFFGTTGPWALSESTNTVNLPPTLALKLFDWLQQERPTLARLAKEERDG